LPICWLGPAPAVSRNRALRCRRSRSSGTCNRLEWVIARSGGKFSGPPGRLTQAGSPCVASRRAPSSPIAHAMYGSPTARSGVSMSIRKATRGLGRSTPPLTSPEYTSLSQLRTRTARSLSAADRASTYLRSSTQEAKPTLRARHDCASCKRSFSETISSSLQPVAAGSH
jgi:hypothetical protein